MEQPTNYTSPDQFNEESEGSSFDYRTWIIRILKGWYFFVISLIVCLGIAYLQNRSWKPVYKTNALVIIEDSKGYMGSQAMLLQGFGAEKAYRNVNNQVIMFGSHDIIERTVKLQPDMLIDYYTLGRFRQTSLYKQSPIEIKTTYISPESYERSFEFTDLGNDEFEIRAEETNSLSEFYCKGTYGVPLESSAFFLTIDKSSMYRTRFNIGFKLHTLETVVMQYSARLSFEFLMTGASVVEVSVTGEVPERDADFINGLCEAFLADNLSRKNDAAIKTIDFINDQLEQLSDSLRISEDRLKAYKADNFVVASSGGNSVMSQYNQIDAKQTEMRLKESYLSYLTNYLQSNVEDGAIIAPANLGVTDANLTSLVQTYTELQLKRKEVGEKSPLHAKYTRELETLKEQMYESLKNMQVALDIQKKDLEERIETVVAEMRQLPYKEQQLLKIQREFKINDDYYTFLMQKRADAQIQKASNSPDNIILDRARVASLINGSEKSKRYSSFLMIALVVPAAFIVLRELLYPSIRTEAEIEKLSGNAYKVISMVRRTNIEHPVVVDKYPKSSIAESFRIIRTYLSLYTLADQPNFSLMVSSSQSGDGKTYMSVNMAAVYAMTGKKTLLVDLDLRKPSILATLSVHANRGLVNHLLNQIDLESAILRHPEYKFDILPVGVIPPNPAELMASDRMKKLIERLKQEYTYIVFDTSPIGLVGDVYPITSMMDHIIYTVACEKTNKNLFKSTIKQMSSRGIKNVSFVFNNVNLKKMEYFTYYQNNYGMFTGYQSQGYAGYVHAARQHQQGYYFDDAELDE
ncbi:MAG: polysaccharide biosynthesis tyrosine autokinase [Paludibacteraceae bacterium]|nr:polysaccharide biosynthesis tyrosine autokinase [Paludibacteraceae bacterium]